MALLFAVMTPMTPAISVVWADDASPIPMSWIQMNQAPPKVPFLGGAQTVRPSPKEREAIYQLLALTPRPNKLKAADMKILQGLRDKPSWFVFEQRMVHELWAEVNGREWRDTE